MGVHLGGSRTQSVRRCHEKVVLVALPWREALRGSKVIPATSWTASSRWSPRNITWAPLIFGLWIFGTGEALFVASEIGNTPWMVLAQGVSQRTGVTVGMATFLVSLVVLALWLPLRERPGLGTVANIFIIATAIDVMLMILPHPSMYAVRVLYAVAGVLVVGFGTALYLTAGLGPGPRDGWMTALHNRTGLPVARVRLFIEIFVLIMGLLLGGTAGLGTVIFALFIGRSVALWLAVIGHLAGS